MTGETLISTNADKLASEIRELPDAEKLRLVDAILTDLDKPDLEIDRIWADEARKRWAAYKEGRLPTVSYEESNGETSRTVKIRFLTLAPRELTMPSCDTNNRLRPQSRLSRTT